MGCLVGRSCGYVGKCVGGLSRAWIGGSVGGKIGGYVCGCVSEWLAGWLSGWLALWVCDRVGAWVG